LDGGYNSSATQDGYNAVVLNTSCASTLSSGDSLSCLRALPFAELNATLSTATGIASSFAPVIDGDLIATYPSLQLRSGAFVPVPLLIGTNTDEGTGFSNGYGPNGGGVNTDSEFLSFLNSTNLIRPSSPASSIIPILYPNIQALGIPSLATDPTPLTTSSPQGLQFRRLSAYLGDTLLIAPRRATSLAWSTRSIPCYTYRFSVVPSGTPPLIGATHFSEVAFVFNNTRGLGYDPNPFQNAPPSFFSLALLMSRAWVSFITMSDPNNHGISGVVEWPAYNATGGGAGRNLVFDTQAQGGALVEWDTWRGEGVAWIESNALGVYGR
jgi:carboxylesterase type B